MVPERHPLEAFEVRREPPGETAIAPERGGEIAGLRVRFTLAEGEQARWSELLARRLGRAAAA